MERSLPGLGQVMQFRWFLAIYLTFNASHILTHYRYLLKSSGTVCGAIITPAYLNSRRSRLNPSDHFLRNNARQRVHLIS